MRSRVPSLAAQINPPLEAGEREKFELSDTKLCIDARFLCRVLPHPVRVLREPYSSAAYVAPCLAICTHIHMYIRGSIANS